MLVSSEFPFFFFPIALTLILSQRERGLARTPNALTLTLSQRERGLVAQLWSLRIPFTTRSATRLTANVMTNSTNPITKSTR